MDKSQAKEFSDELTAIFDVYGKAAPSKAVKNIWWRSLSKFDLTVVIKALGIHVDSSKYFPNPADVIELLIASDGRPTADEAWAIALPARDEDQSVIWTEEIEQAFLSIALPILETGDDIGARIGFRANYERRVDHSRSQGIKARWFMNAGNNLQIRHDTAIKAKEQGLISSDCANPYLLTSTTSEGAEIAVLLGHSGDNVSQITGSALHKERMATLRESIQDGTALVKAKADQAKYEETEKLEARRKVLIEQSKGANS